MSILCQILVVLAIFRHPFHCYILIPRKCPLKTPLHSAPPYLDRSVNPMSTRWGGADYAHQILVPPPRFSGLPTSLRVWQLIAVGVFQRLGDTDRWNYWYWLVPLCYTKWIIFLPCEIALIYIYSSPISKMKNCHKFRHCNSNQFHLNTVFVKFPDKSNFNCW